jgi:hypothetical protein
MPHVGHRFSLTVIALFFSLLLTANIGIAEGPDAATRFQCEPEKPHQMGKDLCLSDTAFEIAQEVCSKNKNDLSNAPKICVSDLIEMLGQMEPADRCCAQATHALLLRQEISEMILTASLQVDGFQSEIDSEIAQIRAVRDELASRRDKAVSHSTFAGAIGTGGGAVGSALALGSAAVATAGSWVGAIFGGVGAVFSFIGYFQQAGPQGCFPDLSTDPNQKKPCSKLDKKSDLTCPSLNLGSDNPCTNANLNQPIGCSPHMLLQLFCPDVVASAKTQDARAWLYHSGYDYAIQRYLAAPSPEHTFSRGATLVQSWAYAAFESNGHVNNSLISGNTDPLKLSIDDLNDRANKLADLRTIVARMNRDLGRLTEDLATGLRCSACR